jgi:hypothetical protein
MIALTRVSAKNQQARFVPLRGGLRGNQLKW